MQVLRASLACVCNVDERSTAVLLTKYLGRQVKPWQSEAIIHRCNLLKQPGAVAKVHQTPALKSFAGLRGRLRSISDFRTGKERLDAWLDHMFESAPASR